MELLFFFQGGVIFKWHVLQRLKMYNNKYNNNVDKLTIYCICIYMLRMLKITFKRKLEALFKFVILSCNPQCV